MEDDDDLAPEIVEKISAILNKQDGEIDEFYSFPDWYPLPIKVMYQILLSNLLTHFYHRWPDEFQPSFLRSWIDHAKEYYADPKNPQAGGFDKEKYPTDFESLELPLIFELARCEHAACLSPEDGLAFIVNRDAVEGWKIQIQRSRKGKKSVEVRRKNAAIRDKKIVTYVRTLSGVFDRGEWAKRAARSFNCSVDTARKAIREAGLYETRQGPSRKKRRNSDNQYNDLAGGRTKVLR